MVLRGSKTKPDASLEEAKKQLQQAKLQLAKIEERLEKAQNDALRSYQELTPEQTADMSKEELIELLAMMVERVNELERERVQVEQKIERSQSEVEKILKQFVAGGLAGATARTFVAPIDRVKILMQTAFISGTADKHTNVVRTFGNIVREEGISGLWRGNGVNCIRVMPYAATQFASYDAYKRMFVSEDGKISVPQRLLCGGLAGATATTFTHPLDVIRLRLSVNKNLAGIRGAIIDVMAENGARSFYKGYIPTLLSLSPFIAINFAAFDTLKSYFLPPGVSKRNMGDHTLAVLGCGAAAGLFAQTCCFPLDTIRRRMQMKGTNYKSVFHAITEIVSKEGIGGFYRGIVPNAIKIVPNNGIRFVAYEVMKSMMGVEGR